MEHTTEVSDGSRAGNPGRSEMAENKQMRGLRFCCGLGRGCGDGCSADLALSEEHQSWGRGLNSLLIFLNRPLGLDIFQSKRWSRVAIQKDILGLWALSMRGDLSHFDIYTDI